MELVKTRGYIRIIDHGNYNPRLIERLTDPDWIGDTQAPDYLALFLETLDHPVIIWDHAFRRQISNRARHLLFVLTTMPVECRFPDLETAFDSLHISQCIKFNQPRSANDFRLALKEIDGTFISNRTTDGEVLVRFQNPSIRDFMQDILLSGEFLSETISSLVFFEQGHWFSVTLCDKAPRTPLTELRRHTMQIVDRLKASFEANSCTYALVGASIFKRISLSAVNLAARLATVAKVADELNVDCNKWIAENLSKLTEGLETGSVPFAQCISPAKALNRYGHLDSQHGKRFLKFLKTRVTHDLEDLGDYELLAEFFESLPDTFADGEVDEIRNVYRDFIYTLAVECNLDSPDEIREEASRIRNTGEIFAVSTEIEEDILAELADEIEKKEESKWDEDRESGHLDDSDGEDCTNEELDSMFNTLDD